MKAAVPVGRPRAQRRLRLGGPTRFAGRCAAFALVAAVAACGSSAGPSGPGDAVAAPDAGMPSRDAGFVSCDDADACTVDSFDDAGRCRHEPDLCDDAVGCTRDRCDPAAGCVHDPDPSLCPDDAVACTAPSCDASAGCGAVPIDALCDDANGCNGREVCDVTAGCVPVGDGCDDGIACTADACDATGRNCVHAPVDASCDDGDACDGVERCVPGAVEAGADGCLATAPGPCDDAFACTVDRCDTAAGGCVHDPSDAACDDGLACDGDERCDPAAPAATADGCVPGAAPRCDDGVTCTDDACVEPGGCARRAVDASCSNGVFCDGVERCAPSAPGADAATGCVPGPGDPCDDAATCTDDYCLPVEGRCLNVARDERCDDGLYCNGRGACAPRVGGADRVTGCVPGPPPAIADDFSCTDDECDERFDQVAHVPRHERCDDALTCDGPERCDPADRRADRRGCVPGDTAALDDGVACTAESCDDAGGVTHTPSDAACDDGRYCNGAERCAPGLPGVDARGCLAGVAPAVDDHLACTLDSCDETRRAVLHLPQAGWCPGGSSCRAVCDPAAGCRTAAPPDGSACDDGSAATAVDVCVRGACAGSRCGDGWRQPAATPDAEGCDDGNDDGGDACSPGCGTTVFAVNTTTVDAQATAAADRAVAGSPRGGFIVAWTDWSRQEPDPDDVAVRARLFAAGGVPLGGDFVVAEATASAQREPVAAALPDGTYLVAWEDWSGATDFAPPGISVRRVAPDGTFPDGAAFRATATQEGGQAVPSIAAFPDGGFVVAWQDESRPSLYSEIHHRLFRPDRAPATAADAESATTQINLQLAPSVAASGDDGFMVVWEDRSGNAPDTSGIAVRGRRFRRGGGSWDAQDAVLSTTTAGDQAGAAVAGLPGAAFVAAWTDGGQPGVGRQVRARVFGAGSAAAAGTYDASNDFAVNVAADGDQHSPSIAVIAEAGGTATVLFAWADDAGGPDGAGVRGRRFRWTGDRLVALDATDVVLTGAADAPGGAPSHPSAAALSDGLFAAAWADTVVEAPWDTDRAGVRGRLVPPDVPVAGR